MIFNTYRADKPVRRKPVEFVEIQVQIPKWALAQTIEEVIYTS